MSRTIGRAILAASMTAVMGFGRPASAQLLQELAGSAPLEPLTSELTGLGVLRFEEGAFVFRNAVTRRVILEELEKDDDALRARAASA